MNQIEKLSNEKGTAIEQWIVRFDPKPDAFIVTSTANAMYAVVDTTTRDRDEQEKVYKRMTAVIQLLDPTEVEYLYHVLRYGLWVIDEAINKADDT